MPLPIPSTYTQTEIQVKLLTLNFSPLPLDPRDDASNLGVKTIRYNVYLAFVSLLLPLPSLLIISKIQFYHAETEEKGWGGRATNTLHNIDN